MPSEVRQRKIRKKLDRAPKCLTLGPQNLGSRAPPPGSASEVYRSTTKLHVKNTIFFKQQVMIFRMGTKMNVIFLNFAKEKILK